MIDLFCGYDRREAVGFHTFCASVMERATQPVSIHPLASMGLPQGSNDFTLSRFLVPHLMGFQGHAIFVDACDMLMLGDIAELDALFDSRYAVQVVKHPDYVSGHERKYVGTEMECAQSNYPKKNWASVMIVNAGHPAWKGVSPCWLSTVPAIQHLQFDAFLDEDIGALPPEWNVLIDEGHEREGAKLLHWTAGLPTFKHYRNARASADWFAEFEEMTGGKQHG
jgi:hypothetical protein